MHGVFELVFVMLKLYVLSYFFRVFITVGYELARRKQVQWGTCPLSLGGHGLCHCLCQPLLVCCPHRSECPGGVPALSPALLCQDTPVCLTDWVEYFYMLGLCITTPFQWFSFISPRHYRLFLQIILINPRIATLWFSIICLNIVYVNL